MRPAARTRVRHRHLGGSLGIAAAQRVAGNAPTPLAAGSFVHLPAGMPHYARANGETIVQINGMGPFDVTYFDPNEDPRKP